jgi:hypothetical protein
MDKYILDVGVQNSVYQRMDTQRGDILHVPERLETCNLLNVAGESCEGRWCQLWERQSRQPTLQVHVEWEKLPPPPSSFSQAVH